MPHYSTILHINSCLTAVLNICLGVAGARNIANGKHCVVMRRALEVGLYLSMAYTALEPLHTYRHPGGINS